MQLDLLEKATELNNQKRITHVYDRQQLLALRDSPLANVFPKNAQQIPGVFEPKLPRPQKKTKCK